ncbi:MAG: DUF1295 domain-containing protein [Alphaproteobacteria bacterium]|nr:MAG: DUF1295 domain-containing protein [Alphaproteobacteria bacterium]
MIASLNQIFLPAMWLYLAVTLITFLALFFITAPYGRHARQGWGPTMPAFWAWMIMEMPAFLALPVYFWISGAPLTWPHLIFILAFSGHYAQRTFYYPWRRRQTSHRWPVTLPALAFTYNLLNGFTNGWYLFAIHAPYTSAWLTDPRFLIGAVLFLVGMVINLHSDKVLLDLRKPGELGYKVPQKGLHRWLASPNYFGEFIEWLGFAVMTWSPAALLFAAYTFANLAPRAHANLKWYRETFDDYPRTRKAFIPFVW